MSLTSGCSIYGPIYTVWARFARSGTDRDSKTIHDSCALSFSFGPGVQVYVELLLPTLSQDIEDAILQTEAPVHMSLPVSEWLRYAVISLLLKYLSWCSPAFLSG